MFINNLLIGFIGALKTSVTLSLETPWTALRILEWHDEPGDIVELLLPSLQGDTASVLREHNMVWIKKSKCREENPNLKFPSDSLDTECQIVSLSCCATESQEKLKLNKETFHAICSDPNQEICSGWRPLKQELPAKPWIRTEVDSTVPHSQAC